MTCIDCKFHGPPVSDYQGPKPCADCIPHPGFPKWEPVTLVGKGVDDEEHGRGTIVMEHTDTVTVQNDETRKLYVLPKSALTPNEEGHES